MVPWCSGIAVPGFTFGATAKLGRDLTATANVFNVNINDIRKKTVVFYSQSSEHTVDFSDR